MRLYAAANQLVDRTLPRALALLDSLDEDYTDLVRWMREQLRAIGKTKEAMRLETEIEKRRPADGPTS